MKVSIKVITRLLDCFDGWGLVITDQELIEERAKELDYDVIFDENSEFNQILDKEEEEEE